MPRNPRETLRDYSVSVNTLGNRLYGFGWQPVGIASSDVVNQLSSNLDPPMQRVPKVVIVIGYLRMHPIVGEEGPALRGQFADTPLALLFLSSFFAPWRGLRHRVYGHEDEQRTSPIANIR